MLHEVLRGLRDDPAFMGCVTHWEVVPAREGRYADLPAGVDPRIRDALRGRGIERIYSHQLSAFNAVRAGRNVVIVSPTASGKTLAYNLPVLQTLLEDPDARALYLFPTKALSQDQQSELNEVVLGGEHPGEDLHLRRGHARRRSASRPARRAGSSSPTPTCCTPASSRTTPSGSRCSRACATS